MERVHALTQLKFDTSRFVAIAIGEINDGQLHVGILHHSPSTQTEFLHLEWHHRLSNDSFVPPAMTVWVDPGATTRRLRQVAARCRQIWRANRRGFIPYGFGSPVDAFDPASSQYLLGPTRFGLTCASFVLAVFHTAGVVLADYSTWPAGRPGDREWQEKIIKYLECSADQSHVDHVRNDIGTVRYRPEEVSAAAAIAPPPASFDSAKNLGRHVLYEINPCLNGARSLDASTWWVRTLGRLARFIGWFRS